MNTFSTHTFWNFPKIFTDFWLDFCEAIANLYFAIGSTFKSVLVNGMTNCFCHFLHHDHYQFATFCHSMTFSFMTLTCSFLITLFICFPCQTLALSRRFLFLWGDMGIAMPFLHFNNVNSK